MAGLACQKKKKLPGLTRPKQPAPILLPLSDNE